MGIQIIIGIDIGICTINPCKIVESIFFIMEP